MSAVRELLALLVAHGVDAIEAGLLMSRVTAELSVPTSAESTRHQVDETAERRRAWDRNYRKNRRASGGHPPDIHPTTERPPDIGDSTRHPPDKSECPPDIHPKSGGELATSFAITSFLSEEDISNIKRVREEAKQESKQEKKESKKERVPSKKGTRLPADWTPNEKHYVKGLERGLNRQVVDDLAEQMREWAAREAHRAVSLKSDWDATFNGFIRREPIRGSYAPRPNDDRGYRAPGPATAREATIIAGMARGAAHNAAQRAPAGQGRHPPRDVGVTIEHDLDGRAARNGDEAPRRPAQIGHVDANVRSPAGSSDDARGVEDDRDVGGEGNR